MRILQEPALQHKSILLLDRAPKSANDRTWCFWEQGTGVFEPVVSHHWKQLEFISPGLYRKFEAAPYRYKMIRSADFYRYCFNEIEKHENVTVLFAPVTTTGHEVGSAWAVADGLKFSARYLFNSIPPSKPDTANGRFFLLQHFKGWVIEAGEDCFDAGTARLMDFRTDQQKGPAFFYVMPLTPRKALVEYTLFTPGLLADEEYDKQLAAYIESNWPGARYTILEKEFGAIPMTNAHFPPADGSIINIGTAGGRVKPSSGYAFRSIQKHSAVIVSSLKRTGHPFDIPAEKQKYHFYDSVFLNVLHQHPDQSDRVFTKMFRTNNPSTIFRFLDNESSYADDLRVISSLRSAPFVKAGFTELIKKATA